MKTLAPNPVSIKVYPQASWTIVDGIKVPFIPSHTIHPEGTIAEATTRRGEKTFIKLLSPHSKTPYGYLYHHEPVKTLILYSKPPVTAGGKFRYNNVPYEVLSVTCNPSVYDEDDRLLSDHYALEVADITAMQEPDPNREWR